LFDGIFEVLYNTLENSYRLKTNLEFSFRDE